MGISLYEASVGTYLQILPSVLNMLRKAETFAADQGINLDDLLQDRLADDMLPLEFQLRSVVHHSLGCIKGMESGVFRPPIHEPDLNYVTLKTRVEEALSEIKEMTPEQIEAYAGKDIVFKMSSLELPFKVEGFVLSFSPPNFHFHATTLYDLLRKRGVSLGKKDYLGAMRVVSK